MSWTSIVGKYVILTTRADLCTKIFNNNSKETLSLELHPNARQILGDNNIAFQMGPSHKALRCSFLGLFTTKALSIYLEKQTSLIHKHIDMWLTEDSCVVSTGNNDSDWEIFSEVRDRVRNLNMETSQTVFLGDRLQDRKMFTNNYVNMTNGFLSVPVNLWCQNILEIEAKAAENGEEVPHFCADEGMADTMMDFLFASQDASTASLCNMVATMSNEPDILKKVREEQRRLRPNHEPLTYELVKSMEYTSAVVLEQLRVRPPAPMVPMIANQDFDLTGTVKCPRGSLIIPSLVGACRDGFPEPDKFDPERFCPARNEMKTHSKSFLAFGTGPHKCVGYNYAIQHLTAFLAILAAETEWIRATKADSDVVSYLPTLYPHDCKVQFQSRE